MDVLEAGMSFVYGIVQLFSIIAVLNTLFCMKINIKIHICVIASIGIIITYFVFGQVNGKLIVQIIFPFVLVLLYNGIRKLFCCIYILPAILICNSLVFSLGILFKCVGFKTYFINLTLQYLIMSIAQITVVWFIHHRISREKAVICLDIREAVWIICVGAVFNNIYNFYFPVDGADKIRYGFVNFEDLCIQVILFVSSIFIFLGILENKIGNFLSAESQKRSMMLELQQRQFIEYKSYQTELRKFRHDINNHFICMSILLRDKKYDDLADYIKSMDNKVKSLSPAVNTGNDILDAILCGKDGILKDENITYTIDGRFLKELNASVTNLCSIFANAIDNAIEANRKLMDIHSRALYITIRNENSFSVITFVNPIIPSDTDMFKSKKKNPENHGFGLDIMRSSAEGCKGSIEFLVENNTFIVSIVLPVNE